MALAERELLRESPKACPRILPGWLDKDKAKPTKLKIDRRSGFLRTPSALVVGAGCLYSSVFDTAWAIL